MGSYLGSEGGGFIKIKQVGQQMQFSSGLPLQQDPLSNPPLSYELTAGGRWWEQVTTDLKNSPPQVPFQGTTGTPR